MLADALINMKVRLPLLNGLSRSEKPNLGSLIGTSLIVEYFSSLLVYLVLFITLVSFENWFEFTVTLDKIVLFILLAHMNFLGTAQAILQWQNKNYILEISETVISFSLPFAIMLSSSPVNLFLLYLGISGLVRFGTFLYAIMPLYARIGKRRFSINFRELDGLWKLHWVSTVRSITEYGEGTIIPILLGNEMFGGFKLIRSLLSPFLSLAQPIQSVFYSTLVRLSNNKEFTKIQLYVNYGIYLFVGFLIYWLFLYNYVTELLNFFNVSISDYNSMLALFYYFPVGFYVLGYYFFPVLSGLREEAFMLRIAILMTTSYVIITVIGLNTTSLIVANFVQFSLQYIAFKFKYNEKTNSFLN